MINNLPVDAGGAGSILDLGTFTSHGAAKSVHHNC